MSEKLSTARKTYYHVTTLVFFIFWVIQFFNEDYLFAMVISFCFWLIGVSVYMGYRSWKVFREEKKIFYLLVSATSYFVAIVFGYDMVTTVYELFTKIS